MGTWGHAGRVSARLLMQRCVCVNCCSRHFERPVFPRVGVAVRRSAISQTPRSSHLVSKVRRRGLARLLPTRVKRMVRQCRRVSGKLLGSIALGSFRVCRGCVPADRDEHLHASKAKNRLSLPRHDASNMRETSASVSDTF